MRTCRTFVKKDRSRYGGNLGGRCIVGPTEETNLGKIRRVKRIFVSSSKNSPDILEGTKLGRLNRGKYE